MALQGTLDTFALPEVLRLLAATRKTGRLRISGGRGTGSAWVAAGEVVRIEATHAPHANEVVEALFELLRFEEGAFTFDADAAHDDPGPPTDVEILLAQSEALLDEWRSIEAVVPSMDAWVTLRPSLPQDEVTVDQVRWTTLVAVGGGATVRRVADDLCLAELPISRAVKELVELGVVELADAPPSGAITTAPVVTPTLARPLLATSEEADLRTSVPFAQRARRSEAPPVAAAVPARDPSGEEPVEEAPMAVDDLTAAFPGLATGTSTTTVDVDDEELAQQLAALSPRAASAIRAAVDAATDEEREAALAAADHDGDQPLNRGLLLKLLSSVKT